MVLALFCFSSSFYLYTPQDWRVDFPLETGPYSTVLNR